MDSLLFLKVLCDLERKKVCVVMAFGMWWVSLKIFCPFVFIF